MSRQRQPALLTCGPAVCAFCDVREARGWYLAQESGPADGYAAHRDAWIATGDPRELSRMLNHALP